MTSDEVISDADFAAKIPELVAAEKTWVIGLSGGADSLCLTMLAHAYAMQHGITLHAAIVDHKLRQESSTEILPILDILKKHDIRHKVLVWEHPEDIGKSLETKAREARYRLLREFCCDVNCNVLMTAHHARDQWETFFMRLARGSSLRGLAGILLVSRLDHIHLVRPLLDFEPQTLIQTLAKRFGIEDFVTDPTNSDPAFERARLREVYTELAGKLALSTGNVNKSISRMQVANSCLDDMASKTVAKMFDGEYLSMETFRDLHIELKMRVLRLAINMTSAKKNEIISYELLQRTAIEICEAGFVGASLGGVVLRKDKTKNVRISRETRLK